MIVRKQWTESWCHRSVLSYDGWYLFGVVPLYVRISRLDAIERKTRP